MRVCRRCRKKVLKSKVPHYPWFCPECYEDLFNFETEEVDNEIVL